jgi:hypothetical protein
LSQLSEIHSGVETESTLIGIGGSGIYEPAGPYYGLLLAEEVLKEARS